MAKARLYFVIGSALLLAVPLVSFVSGLVIFPIAFYAVLAIIANAGLPVVVAGAALRQLGFAIGPSRYYEGWLHCSILWLGCAHGLSHWGDAAASMGGRNIPYFDVLFAPYRFVLGLPVG
ncbi:hypothetical protein [Bosea sp. BK604]|uniref:hypothetical protein n=1 Tax=Bosea sp. BK604 TaxID=2512180 RepID=UPI00105303AD|nr:hypothetical protein [Bosea sp. BK604]TCR69743.1 hypothetical protein EV560_101141 [Bosea sp. BK604]